MTNKLYTNEEVFKRIVRVAKDNFTDRKLVELYVLGDDYFKRVACKALGNYPFNGGRR